MRISWGKSKKKLALIWFLGSGILFVTVILQTLLGRFGDKNTEAWSWFLPLIVPTLSLIIGVFVLDSLGKGVKIRTVDNFMFSLCSKLSILYLIVIAIPIFIRPFTGYSPIEIMQQANLWLLPLQGLVSASLGAFFIQSRP